MSDQKAKCSNRNCGWIGMESQMREVVISLTPLKETELHCPRCDCNSFYYKLKPGEVEKPKTGAQLIALERGRQVKIEGWSAKHDDTHARGEMVDASLSYIRAAINVGHPAMRTPPSVWPWDARFWKPSDDKVRNLVKAGALIAAEIDRLQRKAAAERSRSGGNG